MTKPKRKRGYLDLAERTRRVYAQGVLAGWVPHLPGARETIRAALMGDRAAAHAIITAMDIAAHLEAPPAESAGAVELGPVN